jgi:DNA polymerase III epsilon subunit-like protein
MMANESYNLAIGQIRILRHVLEHYIRNHDVIVHNDEFDVDAMRLIFADLARYCELCKTLNDIVRNHDNQLYKEDK